MRPGETANHTSVGKWSGCMTGTMGQPFYGGGQSSNVAASHRCPLDNPMDTYIEGTKRIYYIEGTKRTGTSAGRADGPRLHLAEYT